MIYPKLPDGTIDWCVLCKHEGRAVYDGCCECDYPENPDDPPTLYEPKPMTNADRIRRMTDEELATYLNDMQGLAYISGLDIEPIRFYPNNYRAWLDWLKQEVKND